MISLFLIWLMFQGHAVWHIWCKSKIFSVSDTQAPASDTWQINIFRNICNKVQLCFSQSKPIKMRNVLKQIDCTKLVTNVLRVWTNQTLQFRLFQFCNFTVPSWKYIHTLVTGQVNLISKCPWAKTYSPLKIPNFVLCDMLTSIFGPGWECCQKFFCHTFIFEH